MKTYILRWGTVTIGRCVSDIMQGGVQAGVGCTQGVEGCGGGRIGCNRCNRLETEWDEEGRIKGMMMF